jgi:Dockerin type I domain
MKHIISIILFLFLGFSPKSAAQTTCNVTVSSDPCLFHYFTVEYYISGTSTSVGTYLPLKTLTLDVPKGQYLYLKFKETAAANENHQNGVSIKDLLMVWDYLVGTKSLTDGQIRSADVNNSGKVTTADVVTIRKMILQMIDTFPNNQSWLLYRRGVNLSLGQNIEEKFLIPDEENIFLFYSAIKVGDVSGNASCK